MDIAITLGYWLNDDGSISDILVRRLNMAKELLDKGLVGYVILSGGVANAKAKISEAMAMKNYLISIGVDEEKLIIEDNSHSTDENFYYSMPIALSYNPKMIYIVSSNEHFTYYKFNPLKQATDHLNKISKDNDIRLVVYTDTYSMDRIKE